MTAKRMNPLKNNGISQTLDRETFADGLSALLMKASWRASRSTSSPRPGLATPRCGRILAFGWSRRVKVTGAKKLSWRKISANAPAWVCPVTVRCCEDPKPLDLYAFCIAAVTPDASLRVRRETWKDSCCLRRWPCGGSWRPSGQVCVCVLCYPTATATQHWLERIMCAVW